MDLRCFIAVEFPDELKKEIESRTFPLRQSGADVKWVRPENLHVTLKFLGLTPEKMLPLITERLREAAGLHEVFEMSLYGVGVFPNERRPRVVWIGIKDSEKLKKLRFSIENEMTALGFEREDREFNAHLTLGRVKSPKGAGEMIKSMAALKDALFGNIRVGSISLMKSELKKTGAQYSRLDEIPLGQKRQTEGDLG